MRQVNIHEAKTHLSRLIEDVAAGEEIIIAKGGKPVAKLVPIAADFTPRKLGLMRGKIWMADDFDAPLPPEVLTGFEGEALVERLLDTNALLWALTDIGCWAVPTIVTGDSRFERYDVPIVRC